MNRIPWLLLLLLLMLLACQSYTPYPRPWGFPRIDVPAKADRSYLTFENESCPLTFEYPAYAKITRSNPDSCWVDIEFEEYQMSWHLTSRYSGQRNLDRFGHFEDYRRLIYQHTKKASEIRETPIQGPNGEGILFEIYGDVGTPAQVFFYDPSEQQIMMMSMYFQTATKNDSLAPVINYMKEELEHVIQTVQWK